MKSTRKLNLHLALMAIALLGSLQGALATTTTFNYTMPATEKTSAAVYTTATPPVLIKTLWSGVSKNSGANTGTWDGTEDNGTTAPSGNYTIKVLANNVTYTWEGVIGNSSTVFTTTTDKIWRCGNIIKDIAFGGTTGVAAMGYEEGQRGVASFTTDPNSPSDVTPPDLTTSWSYAATDGTHIYVADTDNSDSGFAAATATTLRTAIGFGVGPGGAGGADANNSSFVEAYSMTGTLVGFTGGTTVTTSYGTGNTVYSTYTKAIDISQEIHTPGSGDPTFITTNMSTGLAVQQSGTVLAVSHGGLNLVRLFNKTSGATAGTITVTDPRRIAFAPNGDLWVITGTSVERFASATLGTTNTPTTTITGFSSPVGVGVDPTDSNVLVADAGTSQQVKAYSSTGTLVWTLGTAGGYSTNGPNVTTSKFWFINALPVGSQTKGNYYPWAFVAVQSDGTFWVTDGGNNRVLHFTESNTSTPPTYITGGQICDQPDTQTITVDPQNPTRLFGYFGWLEYSFNYGSLQPGLGGGGTWALVKNWAAGVANPENYGGINTVDDILVNGTTQTYAFLLQGAGSGANHYAAAVLPTSGALVFKVNGVGTTPGKYDFIDISGDDISLTTSGTGATETQSLNSKAISFDVNGVPTWATTATVLAGPVPADKTKYPLTRIGHRDYEIMDNNDVLFFSSDDGVNNPGYHIGYVPAAGTAYQWLAGPVKSMTTPDNMGSYPQAASPGGLNGNNPFGIGNYAFWNYNGQYNAAFSNQFVQYYSDGLFIGQFGATSEANHAINAAAGYAGNYFNAVVTQGPDGNLYVFNGDESVHDGIHVWQVANLASVQELVGTGALGSTITLTGTAVPPTIPDASFETPSTSTYIYNPTGGNWTFSGNCGIEHNGSAWGAANAPDGVQAAFLQSGGAGMSGINGQISQTLNFTGTGTYNLHFQVSNRGIQIQVMGVYLDGNLIQTYTPTSSTTWDSDSTAITITTTGNHTIMFGATVTTGNQSLFLDNITWQ